MEQKPSNEIQTNEVNIKNEENKINDEENNINNNIDNDIKIKNKEKEKEDENFIGKIILKKYKIKEKIRQGSQSTIYLSENIKTYDQCAIKVEKNTKDCILKNEIFILSNLQNHKGIVDMITCAYYKEYLILVEKLLGKSLETLFLDSSKNFTLLDICQISLQCLDRIEFVHSKGIIHCDIKPDNFVVGIEDPDVIYLIDFGLGQKYKSNKTGKHIEFGFTGYMTGTARYASRNALRGKKLSRRDDLESFMYMILYFLAKKLPWQGLKAKDLAGKYKKIYLYKKDFNYKSFCKDYPSEISSLFEYIYSLSFKEKPLYDYIRDLFKKILEQKKLYIKPYFSWMDKKKYDSIKKRPLSESRDKKNINKKKIKSSIMGDLKGSTIAVSNLRLSRINSSSINNLDDNNDEIFEENDNDNINNDINNKNNLLSTGTNIKHKLEKYPDDEEEKKNELKKELEIIKEEDEEDENEGKKKGESVHLFELNINDICFQIKNNDNNNNNINNMIKSEIHFNNEKAEIKKKLMEKKDIEKEKKEEIKEKGEKIEENKINIINNEINNNIIINNEKEKEINNINIIKPKEKKEENKITLKELKSSNEMSDFKYKFDLEKKIKAVPKKVVFKKKFKNDGNIKYSSITSQDYDFYKKTGYYSATQRNAKSKISKKFNENSNNINKEKNQNCDIF